MYAKNVRIPTAGLEIPVRLLMRRYIFILILHHSGDIDRRNHQGIKGCALCLAEKDTPGCPDGMHCQQFHDRFWNVESVLFFKGRPIVRMNREITLRFQYQE